MYLLLHLALLFFFSLVSLVKEKFHYLVMRSKCKHLLLSLFIYNNELNTFDHKESIIKIIVAGVCKFAKTHYFCCIMYFM